VADETPARDAKIVQYLNEAYGKEKQLETALTAHIGMTTRAPYKKRLQQHLRETKDHARQLQRRIKKLGGTADAGADLPGPDAVTTTVANIAGRAVAAAQGPIHALRGTGEAEKMLKNAKDEYHEEAEEIANYTAIEALAIAVNDKETARLAKGIRRDEERMARFLERLIPQLTKAVAQDEIPAAERRAASPTRRRAASTSGRRAPSRARSSSSSTRSRASSSRTSRSSGTSSRSSRSGSGGTSSRSSSSRSGSSSARSGSSSRARSGGSSSSRSRRSSSS
jgi:ferritin-like metal-binding protein YciE